MVKKRIIIAALISIISGIVTGQAPQLVSLTPPSPNAQAFQKYGDIPISAYTGVPDISIPVYTIKFRDISVPINISYHASGIKVAEEASNVGLGWALNAGGLITRNIIGTDDFGSGNYFNSGTLNVMDFSDGQGPTQGVIRGCNVPMFNKTIPNQPTLYNYDVTKYLTSSPAVEFQPDQYYYNFPGHSGKFILKRNMQVVLQKQDPIQITCMNATGSIWQIKSAEGFIYDFTLTETYFDNGTGTHTTGWYLTKITSPTGNQVTFNYTPISNYVVPIGSYSETRDDWDEGVPIAANGSQPTTNTGTHAGQIPGKQYSSMVLSSIDFTNGKVMFNYSGGRTDLPNDQKLDSVSIYSQGALQPFKTVAFQYGYFSGVSDICFAKTAAVDVLTKRLKLLQVIEKGYYNGQFIQNSPYIFSYDESNTYPAKTSFARDHWGYFNGSVNKVTLIPTTLSLNALDQVAFNLGLDGQEREPNLFTMSAFSLTSIKYPTGGWTEFQYEPNDFDELQSQVRDVSYFYKVNNNSNAVQNTVAVGYDALSHLYLGVSDTLDLTNEWVSSAIGGGSPLVTVSASFRFSGGTGANCNDVGGSPGQIYYTLKTLSGTQVSQIDPFVLALCNATASNNPCAICQPNSPVFVYSGTYKLPPGKYVWQAFVGTTGAALKLQDIHATFSWYNTLQGSQASQSNYVTIGGGLRVKRIIDHDAVNEANNKTRRYIYHYWADKVNSGVLAEYSYGRRMSKPHYSYFQMSIDQNNQQLSGGCAINPPYAALHLMRSADSNNPLNGSAAGAVVGYDQVTELIGENGEFGKKVFVYSNNPDAVASFTEPYSAQDLPLMPPYGSNLSDPLNGSVVGETDYGLVAGNYTKVKDVLNQYAVTNSTSLPKENIVYGLINNVLPIYNHGDICGTIPSQICDGNSLTLLYQSIQSEWTYLTQSDLKMYNEKGDPSLYEEVLTNYFYDNPNHLQLTRSVTTNSKAEQVTTTTRYPLDFTVPTGSTDPFSLGIQNLQNKHIITTPIEKYVNKQKADGTNIGATSYVLTSFNSTLPSPALAYVSMLSSPNASFAASTINTSGLVKDAAYQPLISFDAYDVNGNLTQQHKVNDALHAYIWDYNNSFLISEVLNAAVNEIAYTSFEADGTGNWTFSDALRNTTNKLTGNQSYNISAGKTISKSGLTSTKIYTVSYWSMNGPLNVNGIASTSGLTKNGWTLYQHTIPSGTTTVTISGSATIDELRLYPKDAQMTTYTYDPVIGLTSTCSSNDTPQNYVYDALGRLRKIVDQDGNIVKTIEYHIQGQTGF
ncbi:MAG: hypothetical protein H7211_08800 [Aquabacterium sp.]|nr:hypothetical protein [Ferruginibacter sp.]